MKDYFTIGETAGTVHTTTETLRHYDRIGLVKPSKKDAWTNYRYYSKQDIVRLNTVCALQQMDLPLQKIKEVLEYDDLEKIIAFLSEALRAADEKIAELEYNKSKILAAKRDYEKKAKRRQGEGRRVEVFPVRAILLSDTLTTPTLDTLWNYLSHFYDMLPEPLHNQFEFEDMAGVYTRNDQSRLFALCTRYGNVKGLKLLPAGEYLCADCTQADRAETASGLLHLAQSEYHVSPTFTVEQIVISGILQWKYQVQVYIGQDDVDMPL